MEADGRDNGVDSVAMSIRVKASFDDGCQLDMRVAELLEKYGIKDTTFYIPSNWESVNYLHGDVPLSISELRSLASRFTIGSHTINHPMLTRIPFKNAAAEIVISKYKLEKLLGVEITSFCYPRGYANDEIRDIVRKHYDSARNTLVGVVTKPDDPMWESTAVHISGTRRKEYEGTTWWAEGKRMLKEAVRRDNNGEDVVFHLWGHSWEIDRYDDWKPFESFLAEVRDACHLST